MSNLFKYTKRVLTSVLAAAVVLTAIPSTAFGAEIDEDLAIEVQDTEVAEAGEEVVVENEDAETTDGASSEEVIVEGEDEDPDQFKNEIDIAFGDVPTVVTAKGAHLYHVGNPNTAINDNPTTLHVDPDNDYSLVVSPDKGYSLINNGDIISMAEYWVTTYDEETGETHEVKRTLTSGWTVTALDLTKEPGFNKGSYVLTFPKALLTQVAEGISYNNITKRGHSGILTVTFKDDAKFTTKQNLSISSITAIGNKVTIRTDYASDTTTCDPTANKVINLSQIVKETTFDADTLKVRAVVKDGSKVVTDIVDGTYTLEADPKDAAVTGASGKKVDDVFTAGTINSAADLKTAAKKWIVVTHKAYHTADATYPDSAIVINKAAIAEIYNAGYTLELVVNGSAADQTKFLATYAENEFVTWGAKDGDGTGTAPTSVVVSAGNKLEASIKTKAPTSGTRTVAAAYYIQDGKTIDDAVALTGTAITAEKGNLATGSDVPAINATVYAITVVPVSKAVTGDAAHYDVYDEDGALANKAVDGEPYKFTIVAKDGYKVSDVKYRLGGDGDSYVSPTVTDGVYSTANVNDNVVIKATLTKDDEVSTVNVKTKADYTTPLDALTVLGKVGGDTVITDGAKIATVVKNQPFYFTVDPKATTIVNSVSYSVGGVNKGTLSAVSTTSAGVITYRIPSATAAVEIAVNTSTAAILKAPISPKVTVDGFRTSEEKTVAKDTMYQFTIRPASDAVTVKDVYAYAVDGTNKATNGDKFTPTDLTEAGKVIKLGSVDATVGYGTFTITPAQFDTLLDIGGGGTEGTIVGIYATTEETVASSKYKVVFSDTSTLGAAGSRMKFEHTGTETTATSITSQEFDPVVSKTVVDMGTNTKLYPINTDGSLGSAEGGLTAEWSVAGTAEVLTVKNKTAGTIVANKAGNETLKVKYTKAESSTAGDKGYGNTRVYTAEVPVVASNRYDSLRIKADITSIYTLADDDPSDDAADVKAVEFATLTIEAIDGQTKKPVTVEAYGNDDVKKITWLFNPDITGNTDKEFFFWDSTAPDISTAANRKESVINNGAAADKAVKVAAEKDKIQADPVKVKAIITYADDSEQTLDDIAISVVKKPTLNYYVIATQDGSKHVFKDATGNAAALEAPLTINSENAKSVTVDYKVYQAESATTITEANIADLLKKGTIEEAKGVSFGAAKVAYYNNSGVEQEKIAATDFVTQSGSGNTFTFTAKAPTSTYGGAWYVKLTAPSVTIGGVAIPELNKAGKDLKITVAQRGTNQAVSLITYDRTTVGTTDTVYEAYPKSDFIAGRSVSEVVDLTSTPSTAVMYHKRTGIEFTTVTEGTSFKLPTAAEMTQVGSKRVLVGWQQYKDYNSNPVDNAGAGNDEAVYAAPGAYVTVGASNNFWKAIWADKYKAEGLMNGNAIVKVTDPADSTKKIDTYQEAIGNTTVGSSVPVVLALSTPELDTTAVTSTTPKVVWNSSPAKMKYVTTLPSDSVTLKDGSPTDALDSTKLKSNIISGAKITTGPTVTVTVKWADPEVTSDIYEKDSSAFAVTENPTYAITKLTKDSSSAELTKLELVEGQEPVTVNVDDFTVGGASDKTDSKNKYTVVWSVGNSAIATLSDGADKWSTVVTPKVQSATASTLKVTITGPDGVKVAEKEIPLTVGEPSAKIVLLDAEGKALSDNSVLSVLAGQAGSTATTFKFKVMNGAGTETTTFTSFGIKTATTDNKLLNGKTTAIAAAITASSSGDGSYVVPVYTNNLVDDDVITVEAEKDGVTYSKDLKITSYFKVNFASATAGSTKTFVTKNGTRVVDKDGNPKDDEIRVTTTDRVWNKTKTAYTFKNIDIAAYAAEFVDSTEATEKTFSSWKKGSKKYTTNIEELSVSDFTAGVFALEPVLFQSVELSISPSTTITLENSTGKTSKKVTLGVTPLSNGLTLMAKADKTGFYKIDPVSDAGVTSWTAGVLTLTSKYVDTSTPRNDFFTVGITDETAGGSNPKAGTAVLSLYSSDANCQPGDLGTITINVNGLNKDTALGKTTYYENGNLVKNDYRVVDGETYYFDKDGYQITGSGITEINGKKVLIVDGKVAQEGSMPTYDGHKYAIGAGGEIKTGWLDATGKASTAAAGVYYASTATDTYGQFASGLTEISGTKYFFDASCKVVRATNTAGEYELLSGYYINAAGEVAFSKLVKVAGKQYLIDQNGELVTYAKSTAGKYVLDGVTYIIDKETNEAKRDDVWYNPSVTWTQKFPSKWDKKDAIPVVAYTVTYTSANEGKNYTTDSIIATVDPATVASDATEVTFTATADLSAFFQDKAGTKKAENKTLVKTYKFPKGGESGQSGQDVDPEGDITIEGLEDSYPWTGKQIKPTFSVYDSVAGKYLAKGVDYTVKYGKNKDAGTKAGSVTITGKGNYAKAGTAAYFDIEKVTPDDPAGEVKSIAKLPAAEYTGSPIYPETISVTLNDSNKTVVTMKHQGDGVYSNDAIGGKELAVSVTNNVDKGSATVAVWGAKNKNGKEVVKTATFKINAKSMEGANATGADGNPFEVTIDASADYRIKTTRPSVEIKFNGNELIEGQDYKVDVNVKKATVKVTGKGNFTKNFEQSFTINKLSLADCEIAAATVYAGAKPSAVKLTILDPNRDIVPTKNYTLTVTPDSDALDSKGKLIEGKNVHVKATGKGDNVDSETYVEGDFTVAANLGKAKVTVPKALTKTYTGSAIELEDSDFGSNGITVTLNGKTLEKDTDFEVTGYQNNVKKGTMTVYITGKGDFSGTKNFKVKIVQKAFDK